MIPGIIGEHIRRSNRRLFLLGLGLLAVPLLILLIPLGLHVFYNFAHGPFPLEAKDIPSLGNPNTLEKYFVRVELDPANFDHIYLHATGGQEHENAYYFFYHLDHSVIFVKTSSEHVPNPVIGTLKTIPDNVWNRGVADAANFPGKPALIGIMIDTSYSFRAQVIVLLVCLALLAAGASTIMLWAVHRARNPHNHPLAKELAKFGSPEEIAVAVDAEFKAGVQYTGPVQTTQSWLLRSRYFGTTLLYLGDVVWAHKLETKRYVHGVPAGSTFSTVICTRYRKRLVLALKSAQVDQLLINIHHSAPYAFIGFNQAWQDAWRRNPAAFIAAVDQRAAQAQTQPQEIPPVPPPPQA